MRTPRTFFMTNKEVHARNANLMKTLDNPITLIEAQNAGNVSRAPNTVMRGLASLLFLCVSTSLMMTSTIIQCNGLCSGYTDVICNII